MTSNRHRIGFHCWNGWKARMFPRGDIIEGPQTVALERISCQWAARWSFFFWPGTKWRILSYPQDHGRRTSSSVSRLTAKWFMKDENRWLVDTTFSVHRTVVQYWTFAGENAQVTCESLARNACQFSLCLKKQQRKIDAWCSPVCQLMTNVLLFSLRVEQVVRMEPAKQD